MKFPDRFDPNRETLQEFAVRIRDGVPAAKKLQAHDFSNFSFPQSLVDVAKLLYWDIPSFYIQVGIALVRDIRPLWSESVKQQRAKN